MKHLTVSVAEFRGPGVRHQFDQDSPDDYELDVPRYRGGRNGRIILLGDGTEVLTDSTDDAEMFDHSMEDDKDEEKQTKEGSSATNEDDSARKDREGTPGPQSEAEKQHMKHSSASQGPGTSIRGIADDPDNKK